MPVMTIGEVAQRTGLRPSAIRFYEKAGVLPSPVRANGQRRYADTVILRLAIIGLARKAGFSIAEVRRLFHGFRDGTPPPVRWRKLAGKKIQEMDELIAQALGIQQILKKTLRCRCLNLEECGRRILAKSAASSC